MMNTAHAAPRAIRMAFCVGTIGTVTRSESFRGGGGEK